MTEQFVNNKLCDFETIEDLQKINKDDLLVLYDFNSLNPNAQADKRSRWPAIETVYLFKTYMDEAVCDLFNSFNWDEINRSPFLIVKYHNSDSLIFQHIPVKENIVNHHKNKRF